MAILHAWVGGIIFTLRRRGVYRFVGEALTVKRFWTPKLNQVVNWIISPILILVGIRFLLMALK